MQLVEIHIKDDKEIEAMCIKAKLLYNQSLYYWRLLELILINI